MDRVITTKNKHPGRVAQGHKLVALNRERKAALKEQPVQQPEQQPEQQPAQQSQTSTVFYGGGALAVLAVIGVALYLYRGKTSDSTPSKAPPAPEHDIFRMN